MNLTLIMERLNHSSKKLFFIPSGCENEKPKNRGLYKFFFSVLDNTTLQYLHFILQFLLLELLCHEKKGRGVGYAKVQI